MIESIDKPKHLHTHVHLCIANYMYNVSILYKEYRLSWPRNVSVKCIIRQSILSDHLSLSLSLSHTHIQ